MHDSDSFSLHQCNQMRHNPGSSHSMLPLKCDRSIGQNSMHVIFQELDLHRAYVTERTLLVFTEGLDFISSLSLALKDSKQQLDLQACRYSLCAKVVLSDSTQTDRG